MSDYNIKAMRQRIMADIDKIDADESSDIITKAKVKAGLYDTSLKCAIFEYQMDKEKRQEKEKRALTIYAMNRQKLLTNKEEEEDYWNLKRIREVIEQWRREFPGEIPDNEMPHSHQLHEWGPQGALLIEAIDDNGGFKEVADKLGLKFNKQVQDEKHQA